MKAFTDAIEGFARRHAGRIRAGRWVASMDGTEVAASVVPAQHRGRTWFAAIEANVIGRVGLQLVRMHAWKGSLPGLPSAAPHGFPALDDAWDEIVKYGAHVAIVGDGRRVIALIDEPLSSDDVRRVSVAVVAIARWDAGLAAFLAQLPDAAPFHSTDLSPAVRLAPDDLRIGVRGGTTMVARLQGVAAPAGRLLPAPTAALVARTGAELYFGHGGAEVVWREVVRDRDRLLAAVAALRSLRGASGPYR